MHAHTKPTDSTDAILDDYELRTVHNQNGNTRSALEHEESEVSTMAGPTRANTIQLEEGRPTNPQRQSYYSEKEEKVHKSIPGQLRAALFNSWINLLLVFVPVGIASFYAGVNP